MKYLLCAIIAMSVGLAANIGWADEEGGDKEKPASVSMKIKLDLSKEILAALTAADFDGLRDSAKAMRTLNKIEDFVRRKTPGYQTQLKTFQFTTDELVRSADKENIDRATLAYAQMTISCVNCHKAIRQE